MKPEIYFLRYAFPCAESLLLRKEITKKEFNELEDAVLRNKIIPKEKLEKIFHRAIEPIKEFAEKKDYWKTDIIRNYFLKRHNECVENNRKGFEHLHGFMKELCKVHIGKITDIKKVQNKIFYVVEYKAENRTNRRIVDSTLLPDLKTGDKVTIHYAYAVEKL